jgi:chromosome segregation ATPase
MVTDDANQEAKITELKDKVEDLQKHVTQWENDYNAKDAELSTKETELQACLEANKWAKAQYETMELERDGANATISRLQGELDTCNNDLATATSANATIAAELAQKTADNKECMSNLTKLQGENTVTKTEIARLQSDVDDLQAAVNTTNDDNGTLTGQFRQAQDEMLRAQRSEFKYINDNERLQADNATRKNTQARLEGELKNISEILYACNKRESDALSGNATIVQTLDTMRSAVTSATQRAELVDAEKGVLVRENDELNTKLQTAKNDVASTRGETDDNKEEIAKQRMRIREQNTQIKQLQKEVADLKARVIDGTRLNERKTPRRNPPEYHDNDSPSMLGVAVHMLRLGGRDDAVVGDVTERQLGAVRRICGVSLSRDLLIRACENLASLT